MADSYFTYSHEDLANKLVDIIGPNNHSNLGHGTAVAYLAAGDTDNGKGGASIGYNTKMVGYGNGLSAQAVYQLSQYPDVKVINMSWSSPFYSSVDDTLYNHIHNDLDVLLVGSAGNRTCLGQYGYCYPASYDSVLSATGVGSRHYRGTNPYSWEDVPEVTIGDTVSTMTINDKVDISAPAFGLFRATNSTLQGDVDTYASWGEGTSMAAPITAGTAALVFAANPNLTALQVKQILKETTDDIYHLPQNQPYLGKLGTGRLNAFRAVMAAKCLDSINGSLDLMVRDNYDDYGQQPNTSTDIFWESVDIWIRNQPDGKDIRDTENPQYSGSGSKAYVYVRVTNKSCVTSTGTEELELYWAKASTSLDWQASWDGSIILNGQPMGGIVNTLEIPSLEPGEDTIIEFEWDVPNPEDYEFLNDEPWHYCLLARINTTADPMAIPETQYITDNVKNNNNLAWKNISVITVNSEDIGTDVSKGAVILVGNPAAYPRNMRLKLFENKKIADIPLYQQAEIRLKLSPEFSNIITPQTNFVNLNYLEQDGVYLVTGEEAYIENLSFDPFEMGTLYLGINFLATQVTDKNNFDIKIAQYDEHNLVGGETFLINKEYNNDILADISSTNIGSNIILQSTNTYPQTIYNWYDSQNNLLYSGSDFAISNTVADVYKLEIISEEDGFKDYAEIIINGNSSTSLDIYPNPTNSVLNIDYDLQGANGYINITNINNNSISNNYILNNMDNTITIDVSNYTNGYYNVAFVKNGSVYKSAIFIKK